METTAYPLSWPAGHSRTEKPTGSRFKNNTVNNSCVELLHEIKLLGGVLPIISTNIPSRGDGTPYSDYSKKHIKDLGVAVYFVYDKEQFVLACDRWDSVEDNIWAIKLAVEAMRGLDRWGVSDMLKRSFTGFKALPESIITPRKWHEVLGIRPDLPDSTEDKVKARYYELAKKFHPDNQQTGNENEFKEVNEAWEHIKKQRGWI